jgi:hypothetical protein
MSHRVAVEIPLAREATPTGEDGQGHHLSRGEGRLGSAPPAFGWMGLAEVVHHDVECGEEGVLKSSMSQILSLRG